MKKLIAMVLPLALAITFVFPAKAVTIYAAESVSVDMYFPVDIEEHWAFDELDHFVSADLLKGYQAADGTVTVKPEQSINRAEFVAMLVRALGLKSEQTGKTFADVPADKWYFESIRIASSLDVVNGVSETNFEPTKRINRGDIATMIVRAFKNSIPFNNEAGDLPFADVPNNYAKEAITAAYHAGIVNGKTQQQFKPLANAKRAEAVVMLQRALDLQKSDVPADATLFDVISNADTTANEAINNKQFDQLYVLNQKYFAGYQLAYNNAFYDQLLALKDEGIFMNFEKITDSQLTVLDKTDRFAVVEATKGSNKVTAVQNGEATSEIVSNDAIYLLKKMDDNSWKIYLANSTVE